MRGVEGGVGWVVLAAAAGLGADPRPWPGSVRGAGGDWPHSTGSLARERRKLGAPSFLSGSLPCTGAHSQAHTPAEESRKPHPPTNLSLLRCLDRMLGGSQAGPSQASGIQLCLHMVWLGAFLCAQPGLRGAPRKPPWASVWNSGAGSPVQARAWLGQGQSLPLGPQGLRSHGAEAPYALWRSLWGQGQQNVGLGSHSGVGAQSRLLHRDLVWGHLD